MLRAALIACLALVAPTHAKSVGFDESLEEMHLKTAIEELTMDFPAHLSSSEFKSELLETAKEIMNLDEEEVGERELDIQKRYFAHELAEKSAEIDPEEIDEEGIADALKWVKKKAKGAVDWITGKDLCGKIDRACKYAQPKCRAAEAKIAKLNPGMESEEESVDAEGEMLSAMLTEMELPEELNNEEAKAELIESAKELRAMDLAEAMETHTDFAKEYMAHELAAMASGEDDEELDVDEAGLFKKAGKWARRTWSKGKKWVKKTAKKIKSGVASIRDKIKAGIAWLKGKKVCSKMNSYCATAVSGCKGLEKKIQGAVGEA